MKCAWCNQEKDQVKALIRVWGDVRGQYLETDISAINNTDCYICEDCVKEHNPALINLH